MKRHRNYLFGLAVTLLTLTASFAITAGAAQRGDIDADGVVTPADARLALRCSVGLPKKDDPASGFSEKEKDLADMDMDLRVSAADARAILRTAVRLDPPLPYYAFTVISAPTCTEAGSKTCKVCGKKESGAAALGHDWVHHEEEGHWRDVLTCRCGAVFYSYEEWVKHSDENWNDDHGGYSDYSEWVVDKPAYDACSRCGITKT